MDTELEGNASRQSTDSLVRSLLEVLRLAAPRGRGTEEVLACAGSWKPMKESSKWNYRRSRGAGGETCEGGHRFFGHRLVSDLF